MACQILLIEDNDNIRENTVELLELEGYQVLAVGNGGRALELIAERIPDLIICDVVMPGLSGYDVFSALQNNRNTRSIPFIFASALSEPTDLAKAKAFGLRHYLVKPYDDTELMYCVRAYISKQK